MNSEGRVFAKKQDKFRQVNRFLEIIADVVKHLSPNENIYVVDFGCGKAALTFSLFAFLNNLFGERVYVHGVDQKKDVITSCQALANKINAKRLTFSCESIEAFRPSQKVSMVVALHACDTATDEALLKALEWGVEVIVAVPCCQHELLSQVEHPDLKPLLKHGILKERFASLVTDAVRAQFLEERGYAVQVLEFIDFEHTPKNILIRAFKKKGPSPSECLTFTQKLNIKPKLFTN